MRRTVMMSAVLAIFVAGNAAAAEKRCGWFSNPTPGNFWLEDREATWTLRTQGSEEEPEGMDLITDFSEREFVRTNGYYGYACACMSVDVNKPDERITKIYSFKQLPLAACRRDKALPKM